ncbi:CLIP domain-containing serine protease HP8-like isoform X1 [Macrobrachium nipponense]|uniref:CLIP domain-containing serine protease HP8-like isoform X1 n=1 Tax=Macrobrachium nipponense TaxID=159736 RepID=UPI0030C88428
MRRRSHFRALCFNCRSLRPSQDWIHFAERPTGEHTLSTDPDCRGFCADPVQRIGVEQTVIHEDYGIPFGCRNCNDIALLRLSRKVELTNVYVHPVCLPLNLQNDLGFSQDQFDQREGWVAGWGTTDPREARPADVLQQVLLPINSSLCSLDLRVFPDPHMALCAGGQRKDTCRGDSGGPMVIPNDRDLNYLVGIVSRGPVVCGAANTGGLYTNVNHYVPWILRNLRP